MDMHLVAERERLDKASALYEDQSTTQGRQLQGDLVPCILGGGPLPLIQHPHSGMRCSPRTLTHLGGDIEGRSSCRELVQCIGSGEMGASLAGGER